MWLAQDGEPSPVALPSVATAFGRPCEAITLGMAKLLLSQ